MNYDGWKNKSTPDKAADRRIFKNSEPKKGSWNGNIVFVNWKDGNEHDKKL